MTNSSSWVQTNFYKLSSRMVWKKMIKALKTKDLEDDIYLFFFRVVLLLFVPSLKVMPKSYKVEIIVFALISKN